MNCSDEFPSTDVFYSEISDDAVGIVILVLALGLVVIQSLIFLEEVWYILKNHTDPVRIPKIITLLGVYPVVSFTSAVAVLVPPSSIMVDLVSACYLSVCIQVFVTLVIEYFHGEDNMIKTLSHKPFILNNGPCCCCCFCLPRTKLTRKKLLFYKIIVLQVAIVRVLLLFVAAVLWTDGKYVQGGSDPGSADLYINILSAISTLTAMYGFMVIFRNSREHLKEQKLGVRFFTLQLVIVIINVQRLIFSILARYDIPECIDSRGSKVRGTNWNHGIMIVEMFLLSLLARYGYRRPEVLSLSTELQPDDIKQQEANSVEIDKHGSYVNPVCVMEVEEKKTRM